MLVKQWRVAVRFRQIIVRNSRAQVMFVVETYIAGEPLQRLWQAVISAALDSREHIVPVVLSVLVDILILMLYVEKPQGISAEEKEVDELHEQELLPSQEIGKYGI